MRNSLVWCICYGAIITAGCKPPSRDERAISRGIAANKMTAIETADLGSTFVDAMKRCDRDDQRACVEAAYALLEARGIARNEMLAVTLLKNACPKVPEACNDLGELYRAGRGVDRDPSAAARNYRLACDGGDIFGCANLAQSLVAGVGVSKNAAAAVQLFQRACDAKDMSSCFNAGVAYDNGIGVHLDRARAAKDYEPACDAGNAMACANLGMLLAKGDGVKKSESAALERFEKGCVQENAQSCRNAGVVLKKSKLPRQGRTPEAFFNRACRLGDRESCELSKGGSL